MFCFTAVLFSINKIYHTFGRIFRLVGRELKLLWNSDKISSWYMTRSYTWCLQILYWFWRNDTESEVFIDLCMFNASYWRHYLILMYCRLRWKCDKFICLVTTVVTAIIVSRSERYEGQWLSSGRICVICPHESVRFREFLYKVFSYFKFEVDTVCVCLSLTMPLAFVHVSLFTRFSSHFMCQQTIIITDACRPSIETSSLHIISYQKITKVVQTQLMYQNPEL
jgi:hypothetical protein